MMYDIFGIVVGRMLKVLEFQSSLVSLMSDPERLELCQDKVYGPEELV